MYITGQIKIQGSFTVEHKDDEDNDYLVLELEDALDLYEELKKYFANNKESNKTPFGLPVNPYPHGVRFSEPNTANPLPQMFWASC